jgi:hypothetical protein
MRYRLKTDHSVEFEGELKTDYSVEPEGERLCVTSSWGEQLYTGLVGKDFLKMPAGLFHKLWEPVPDQPNMFNKQLLYHALHLEFKHGAARGSGEFFSTAIDPLGRNQRVQQLDVAMLVEYVAGRMLDDRVRVEVSKSYCVEVDE